MNKTYHQVKVTIGQGFSEISFELAVWAAVDASDEELRFLAYQQLAELIRNLKIEEVA